MIDKSYRTNHTNYGSCCLLLYIKINQCFSLHWTKLMFVSLKRIIGFWTELSWTQLKIDDTSDWNEIHNEYFVFFFFSILRYSARPPHRGRIGHFCMLANISHFIFLRSFIHFVYVYCLWWSHNDIVCLFCPSRPPEKLMTESNQYHQLNVDNNTISNFNEQYLIHSNLCSSYNVIFSVIFHIGK